MCVIYVCVWVWKWGEGGVYRKWKMSRGGGREFLAFGTYTPKIKVGFAFLASKSDSWGGFFSFPFLL